MNEPCYTIVDGAINHSAYGPQVFTVSDGGLPSHRDEALRILCRKLNESLHFTPLLASLERAVELLDNVMDSGQVDENDTGVRQAMEDIGEMRAAIDAAKYMGR